VMTREAEERVRQSFNNPTAGPGALTMLPTPAVAAAADGRPSFVPNLASQVSQPSPVPAAPATPPAR
jgi:hypothetical protein